MRILLGLTSSPGELEQMVKVGTSVLGSFYDRRGLNKLLELKYKGVWIMLDSGAFTWWNKNVGTSKDVKDVIGTDWSRGSGFEKYKREYIDWLKKFGSFIDVYVTLDVIFDPGRTWAVWKEMREEGLSPVPVVHYGTDYRLVEKYLEEGVKYIGTGGLVGGRKVISQWMDGIFKNFVKVDGEEPFPKVHIFGAVTPDVFKRYPLYSADSTGWKKYCAYGFVPVPLIGRGGEFTFETLFVVKVTRRRTSDDKGKCFSDYVKMVGEEVVKRVAKEVFGEEIGVQEIEERLQDSIERGKWSIWYYREMEKWWSKFRDWEVFRVGSRKYLV
jgi:hypothetical protein